MALILGCKAVAVDPRFAPVHTRAEILARDIAWASDTLPLLRFNPPWEYGAIRLRVEQCVGRTRADWPRFYIAPLNPMPGHVLAFYDEGNQSIVFGLGNEANPGTVAHELLHWLLAPVIPPHRRHDETVEAWVERVHPDSIFAPHGRCGHILNPGS